MCKSYLRRVSEDCPTPLPSHPFIPASRPISLGNMGVLSRDKGLCQHCLLKVEAKCSASVLTYLSCCRESGAVTALGAYATGTGNTGSKLVQRGEAGCATWGGSPHVA